MGTTPTLVLVLVISHAVRSWWPWSEPPAPDCFDNTTDAKNTSEVALAFGRDELVRFVKRPNLEIEFLLGLVACLLVFILCHRAAEPPQRRARIIRHGGA